MKELYDCGLIIKQLREKSNMTQQELGRRIDHDKGIISGYENNYQPVPFETMRHSPPFSMFQRTTLWDRPTAFKIKNKKADFSKEHQD